MLRRLWNNCQTVLTLNSVQDDDGNDLNGRTSIAWTLTGPVEVDQNGVEIDPTATAEEVADGTFAYEADSDAVYKATVTKTQAGGMTTYKHYRLAIDDDSIGLGELFIVQAVPYQGNAESEG